MPFEDELAVRLLDLRLGDAAALTSRILRAVSGSSLDLSAQRGAGKQHRSAGDIHTSARGEAHEASHRTCLLYTSPSPRDAHES
eukprot:1730471-Prymnesium_polylepis.2